MYIKFGWEWSGCLEVWRNMFSALEFFWWGKAAAPSASEDATLPKLFHYHPSVEIVGWFLNCIVCVRIHKFISSESLNLKAARIVFTFVFTQADWNEKCTAPSPISCNTLGNALSHKPGFLEKLLRKNKAVCVVNKNFKKGEAKLENKYQTNLVIRNNSRRF